MVGGVAPVIALRPRRSRKQADPFIVADRLDLGRRCLGEVADGQASLGHHPLTLSLLQAPYWEPIFLCKGRTTVGASCCSVYDGCGSPGPSVDPVYRRILWAELLVTAGRFAGELAAGWGAGAGPLQGG